jgi:hypothetical protein
MRHLRSQFAIELSFVDATPPAVWRLSVPDHGQPFGSARVGVYPALRTNVLSYSFLPSTM